MDVKILVIYRTTRPLNSWFYVSKLHIFNFVKKALSSLGGISRATVNNTKVVGCGAHRSYF
jgi:hypothetical protein